MEQKRIELQKQTSIVQKLQPFSSKSAVQSKASTLVEASNAAVATASPGTKFTDSFNSEAPRQIVNNLAPEIYILSVLFLLLLWIKIVTKKLHLPTSLKHQLQHQGSKKKIARKKPLEVKLYV